MSQSSSTPSSTLRPRVEILGRITELARELAGAYRPATVIERLASAIAEMLTPDRLTILALDADTNMLSVAFHRGGEPAHTDDPLLQLPLRLGPLVFPRHVAEQAARHEVVVTGDTPATWLAGRPYHSLLPATWVPTVTAVLAQPSPGPQDLRAGDRVYLVSSVPMTGTPEGGGAAVLLFDDLTEKRRLQEQLMQSEKM